MSFLYGEFVLHCDNHSFMLNALIIALFMYIEQSLSLCHTRAHTHTHTHTLGAPRTFADEAGLLRKVSNHKSIISPPSVQILNFSDDGLQQFFSTLLQQKQVLVRELFMSGGCMEAYIYPLYGVTMATRVKVRHYISYSVHCSQGECNRNSRTPLWKCYCS